MSNTNVTLELLSQYMKAHDMDHTISDDGQTIETSFTGDSGLFKVYVALWGDDPLTLLAGACIPVIVPEKHRLAMAEAIARANCGMFIGGFRLDMGTGVLAFKADMPVADGTVTEEQLHALLVSAMGLADTYFPAFLRLIYGDDLSPAEVVAEVEMAK